MRTFSPVYANPLGFLRDFDFNFDQSLNDKSVATYNFESKETPESWLMSIEVPGVKDEDLEIEVEDKILSVKGIKYNPLDEDTKKEFTKNFRLPESVDLEAIEAKLNHGILVVTLPKRLEKRSRKIEISTSGSVQAAGTISKDTETTVAQ